MTVSIWGVCRRGLDGLGKPSRLAGRRAAVGLLANPSSSSGGRSRSIDQMLLETHSI